MAPRTSGCRIDHLVVTAPDLESGARWLADGLGVAPAAGGQHLSMGTHNRLLRLQDEVYLEVIAADPSQPPPGRRRWFGLDDLPPTASPSLGAWVVRTDDLAGHREAACAAGADPGPVQALQRGPWHWRITVPADGRAPLQGLAPALIEWPDERHPAAGLPPSGVRLVGLTLHHPDPDAVQALLDRLGLAAEVAVVRAAAGGEPFLDALFSTPTGPCRLSCTRWHRP